MHQTREDLDILFRKTAPEAVLKHLRMLCAFGEDKKMVARIDEYGQDTYSHYATLNLSEYSPDEIEMRYAALKKLLETSGSGTLFSLLVNYADKVLILQDGQPICKLEEVLNWNSITKRLGQDVFITSWLAWHDVKEGIQRRDAFSWATVIKTDDWRLHSVLKKGLAENHFHLNGSTQVFAISWACLMNHPMRIEEYLATDDRFSENLSVNVSRGVVDNVLEWKERLLYAVLIRSCLSKRCMDLMEEQEVLEQFMQFDAMPLAHRLKTEVETLRFYYGAKFEQPDHSKKCLDYANSVFFYQVDSEHCNRLLAGERSFLYHCFQKQFCGKFTLLESNLFYLYLLIKNNFASELIQNNNKVGFKNFALYQNRKDQCFGQMPEYVAEAYRLAVRTILEENHLMSLETRIMVQKSLTSMKSLIRKTDGLVRFSDCSRTDWPYFYVLHFPKKKFSPSEYDNGSILSFPRNRYTRQVAKRAAMALRTYIQKFEMLRQEQDCGQRVFGIDACSNEIGCRPETFATEFRYLRNGLISESEYWYQEHRPEYVNIRATYHVGEDFLDITDGLRAIDEAILFLRLRKGDRLGHAIVLGVDAAEYYAGKKYSICITKQDYLDNLVWVLYRSLELDIPINANYRAVIKEKAREMLLQIYLGKAGEHLCGNDIYVGDILENYYHSWKLRGDHPCRYQSGEFEIFPKNILHEYWECEKNGDELDYYRAMKSVTDFVYLYHFDKGVKDRGLEPTYLRWENWAWYAELMTRFQNKLLRKIASIGISIECNPTSNVLIGTFKRYDEHPILRFSKHRLEKTAEQINVVASINTDDLGIFDTSIENEYALLLCALRRMRNDADNFNDEAIYDYLDYLRECGMNMSFGIR